MSDMLENRSDAVLNEDEAEALAALDAKIAEAAGDDEEQEESPMTPVQKVGIIAAVLAGCLVIFGALMLFFNSIATKGYVVDKYWTLTMEVDGSVTDLCSGRSPVDLGVLQADYGYTPDNADYKLTYMLRLQAENPSEYEADIRDTYNVNVTEARWLETEIGTQVKITGNG